MHPDSELNLYGQPASSCYHSNPPQTPSLRSDPCCFHGHETPTINWNNGRKLQGGKREIEIEKKNPSSHSPFEAVKSMATVKFNCVLEEKKKKKQVKVIADSSPTSCTICDVMAG